MWHGFIRGKIHNTNWHLSFDEINYCLSKDSNIDLIYLGYWHLILITTGSH